MRDDPLEVLRVLRYRVRADLLVPHIRVLEEIAQTRQIAVDRPAIEHTVDHARRVRPGVGGNRREIRVVLYGVAGEKLREVLALGFDEFSRAWRDKRAGNAREEVDDVRDVVACHHCRHSEWIVRPRDLRHLKIRIQRFVDGLTGGILVVRGGRRIVVDREGIDVTTRARRRLVPRHRRVLGIIVPAQRHARVVRIVIRLGCQIGWKVVR